jgi:hypothetical protein
MYHHGFVADPDSPKWVEDFYVSMRTETIDVPKVAEAAGLDPALVEVAKRNLFVNTHDVPIRGGDLRRGYFTPIEQVAQLWTAAMDGKALIPDQVRELRSLIAHEYVEARLLEAGVPYRYADPRLWGEEGDFYDFSREHAGAHEVAPKSLQGSEGVDLLRHWKLLGLKPPPGGLAPDLSNLDDIVRFAREGMGW